MDKFKLSDFGKLHINKKNNQNNINLKKRVLKKAGLTPEDLMELDLSSYLNKRKSSFGFEDNFHSKWKD